ncbi:MAG: Hachiman antiphage defense system protein HamA [Bacilli bacterium]|nr:Hachiman antiphage defense system protein HamA [Bacilli bacterium]
MLRKTFNPFTVVSEGENYIFLFLELDDIERIAQECLEFFFSADTVFDFFTAHEGPLVFAPTKANRIALYRNLSYYIDSLEREIPSSDKYGKLGEYFLSILLLKYFQQKCLFPKIISVTDNDSPVHGFDAVFYDEKANMLSFGEAKFTDDISSGIGLINQSIKEYESQFDDELRFLVKMDVFKESSNETLRTLAQSADECIDFRDFIRVAGLTDICVPMFICHGVEIDESKIITKLSSISKPPQLLGLNVKYLAISMPIQEKRRFGMELNALLRMEAFKYAK